MINKVDDIKTTSDEGIMLLAALPLLKKFVFNNKGYNKIIAYFNTAIAEIKKKEGKL